MALGFKNKDGEPIPLGTIISREDVNIEDWRLNDLVIDGYLEKLIS